MLIIKFRRMSEGLTQWQIAQSAKMSQGRYSMIERGLIEPTHEERERLAQTLGAPASTLLRSAIRMRRQPEEKTVSQPEV